jgi:hypothetical protein
MHAITLPTEEFTIASNAVFIKASTTFFLEWAPGSAGPLEDSSMIPLAGKESLSLRWFFADMYTGDRRSFSRSTEYIQLSLRLLNVASLQIPILAFSFVLVALKVNISLPEDVRSQSLRSRLQRIE